MEAKMQLFFLKEAVKTSLNLLLSVICRVLWMINRPRGEKIKKKPEQQEQNKKPLIGKTIVLCLEDDWGRAAEEKKQQHQSG